MFSGILNYKFDYVLLILKIQLYVECMDKFYEG
jgi:hypothetical protein